MFKMCYYPLSYNKEIVGRGITVVTDFKGNKSTQVFDFSLETLSMCRFPMDAYCEDLFVQNLVKSGTDLVRVSEAKRGIIAKELTNPEDIGFLLDILGKLWEPSSVGNFGFYEKLVVRYNGELLRITGVDFNSFSLNLARLNKSGDILATYTVPVCSIQKQS